MIRVGTGRFVAQHGATDVGGRLVMSTRGGVGGGRWTIRDAGSSPWARHRLMSLNLVAALNV